MAIKGCLKGTGVLQDKAAAIKHLFFVQCSLRVSLYCTAETGTNTSRKAKVLSFLGRPPEIR